MLLNLDLMWRDLIFQERTARSHVFCFFRGKGKMKMDKGITWKNSGNKDQYEHNEKVSDTLTQALWTLNNDKY
jgi:hypothetical protein